jgi:hypothetical protein
VKRLASLPRAVRAYAAIVLLNYAAQVPYAADLYGTHLNVAGAALLGATLAWFLVGLWGLADGRRAGYLVLLAYAATQVAFYFHGQVLLAFVGYGMVYALTHARDGVVWAVFLVGDLNFVAAVGAAAYLVVRRRSLGPLR